MRGSGTGFTVKVAVGAFRARRNLHAGEEAHDRQREPRKVSITERFACPRHTPSAISPARALIHELAITRPVRSVTRMRFLRRMLIGPDR